MRETVDCVVIGAGIVGLAVARALALAGHDVIVLERENAIGTGTSSRNSEVIHAGIYYPPQSLKAQLCIAGKAMLYAYCAERGIAHRAIGKVLVATEESQRAKLNTLHQNALASGVSDLVVLDSAGVTALEPQVKAVAGLFSPSSGIVDSHGVMLAFQGDLEAHGGMIAFNAPVEQASVEADGIALEVGGHAGMTLLAKTVINAAGLGAPDLARRFAGLPSAVVPQAFYAKGHYFSLSGHPSPFSHLVYPMPEKAGLGIHATLDLGGQVKFGPDVAWVNGEDYAPDPARMAGFEAAIRLYWPDLPEAALAPSYTGIRPKIVGPGMDAADFVIQSAAEHGVAGLINLFGIESPGLTASLAIADAVVSRLKSA